MKDIIKLTCPRCKGHKYIRGQEGNPYYGESYKLANYKEIQGGICFLCDGQGTANYSKEYNCFVKRKNGALLSYNSKGAYVGIIEEKDKNELKFDLVLGEPTWE